MFKTATPNRSRDSTPVNKRKNASKRRSRSAGAGSGGIRKSPADDATIFANRIPKSQKDKKIRVLVIHGDPTKPNPILPGGKWDEDDFESVDLLKKALSKLEDSFEFKFLCNHDTLIADLQKISKAGSADLVLQFCDEGYMNNARMEMHITAYLEMVGIPYTGTGPVALGITYDKQIVLEIAKSIGIPVPQSVLVEKDDEIISAIRNNNLEFPLFIKPNCTDGSYGITQKSICRSDEDVLQAVKMIRDSFFVVGPILVQEFLEGNDLNTAIIGNSSNMTFLPITEEDYSDVPAELPRILGFESKWDENSPYFRIGTILAKSVSEETKAFMNECSAKLCKRIGLRDYVRFDWKLDAKGKPRLLEANPNCGWSYDAHLQRMCALVDISYSQMLRMILNSASQRLTNHLAKAKEEKSVNLSEVSKHRLSDKQSASNAKGPLKL